MENCLNPDLDLEKIRTEFQSTGMVVIDQILKPEVAESLHSFLINMPDETERSWWTWARWTEDTGARLVYTQPIHKEQSEKLRKDAQERRKKGLYSYAFKRTAEDHYATCNCRLCMFKQWLSSDEMMNFVGDITGNRYHLINMFANKYQAGDYLDRHTDKVGPRDLTYVFNLTKNWKAEFGGLLLMIDQGRFYVPGFNKLILFNLPPGGRLHCVTEVAQGIEEPRLGITGWMRTARD